MKVSTRIAFGDVNCRYVDSYLIEQIVEEVKCELTNSLECKTVNEDEPIFIHIQINLKEDQNGTEH